MRKGSLTVVLVLALGLGGWACKEDEGADIDIGDDTLQVTIPEDTEERLERGARRMGGAVGEALEETGEAIEDAGTRIQEEVGEGETQEEMVEPDTAAM